MIWITRLVGLLGLFRWRFCFRANIWRDKGLYSFATATVAVPPSPLPASQRQRQEQQKLGCKNGAERKLNYVIVSRANLDSDCAIYIHYTNIPAVIVSPLDRRDARASELLAKDDSCGRKYVEPADPHHGSAGGEDAAREG